jgi:DNA mismatch repair protein MutS
MPAVGDEASAAAASLLHPPGARQPAVEVEPLSDAAARDLQLAPLFAALSKDAPWLAPWYATPCADVDTVRFRQAIAGELLRPEVAEPLRTFARRIHRVRQRLDAVQRLPYRYVAEAWFLANAHRYVRATTALLEELDPLELRADGLTGCRDAVRGLVEGERFRSLAADAAEVQEALDAVAYTVRVQAGRITVDRDHDEPDLTAEVAATFARFRTGPPRPVEWPALEPGVDLVTARILELVADQHADAFTGLLEFQARHRPLLDPTIAGLAQEVPFYLAYLDRTERLRAGGLPFCDPDLVGPGEPCSAEDSYDLAVATKRLADGQPVVTNDWQLAPPERLLVVTGANQGGKTTFARAFGQLHHLASLGLPVPARRATIGLHDRLLTHFERQERITTLRGKLEDELVRVHDLLTRATPDSVVFLNETFSSTTLQDARDLGTAVLEQLARLGARGVFVTFVDELASVGGATVSMVATVAPDDPTVRTFRVVRRPPDGLAHAVALAGRYGLTYETLTRRLAP